MFGGLTCLFNGLAFFGAGYAVVLQLRALKLQQEEIVKNDRRHEAADKERELESKQSSFWQRRLALLQTTSFLVQAQAQSQSCRGVRSVPGVRSVGLRKVTRFDSGCERRLGFYLLSDCPGEGSQNIEAERTVATADVELTESERPKACFQRGRYTAITSLTTVARKICGHRGGPKALLVNWL
jgi:hypothetical protein